MKKTTDGNGQDTDLAAIGSRWRATAEAEEQKVLDELNALASAPVGAARAALAIYAEVNRQHGARLRAEQRELKDDVFTRSRWVLDVARVREHGGEILGYLDGNPGLITKHLNEVARMTPAYATSHRLTRILIPALTGLADTGGRLPELVAAYDSELALVKRRLQAEAPDLAPRPGLASAGVDAPPPRSRFARSTLGRGDAA